MKRSWRRALQRGRNFLLRSDRSLLILRQITECGLERADWLLRYTEDHLGGRLSRKAQLPVDSLSHPLPWMTYPAIEFLADHDFSNCVVFEFGSGNSSRYWAARCRSIDSVERDPAWYSAGISSLVGNQTLVLRETSLEYATAIHEQDRVYDVIIIDGSYRYDCAVQALSRLADGGMLILDNSDWYGNTCTLLRSADLLQVDFKGLGPLNSYAWCTSIFFHRNFRIPRRGPESALAVVGGIVQQSDGDRSHISIDQCEFHAPTH